MKKFLTILAIVTGLGFVTPTESSARDYHAGDRRIVSRHACGESIYSTYTVTKRDRRGHPVAYSWVQEPHRCRLDRRDDRRDDHRGHDHDHDRDRDRTPPRRGLFFFFGGR